MKLCGTHRTNTLYSSSSSEVNLLHTARSLRSNVSKLLQQNVHTWNTYSTYFTMPRKKGHTLNLSQLYRLNIADTNE